MFRVIENLGILIDMGVYRYMAGHLIYGYAAADT